MTPILKNHPSGRRVVWTLRWYCRSIFPLNWPVAHSWLAVGSRGILTGTESAEHALDWLVRTVVFVCFVWLLFYSFTVVLNVQISRCRWCWCTNDRCHHCWAFLRVPGSNRFCPIPKQPVLKHEEANTANVPTSPFLPCFALLPPWSLQSGDASGLLVLEGMKTSGSSTGQGSLHSQIPQLLMFPPS